MAPVLSEEDVRQIRAALSEGASQQELAVEFGVHRCTIGRVARRQTHRNVESAICPRRWRLDEEEVGEMVAEVRSGVRVGKVAQAFSVHRSTVYYWLAWHSLRSSAAEKAHASA